MSIKKYAAIFAGLVLVQVVFPAQGKLDSPEDFAASIRIDLEPGKPLYEFYLTQPVYLNLQRQDLADMRIVDSDNKQVPFVRQSNQGALNSRTNLSPFSTRIFPLFADKGKQIKDIHVHVSTNAQGSIIDIKTANGNQDRKNKRKIGYLVDTSHIKQPISEFRLSWRPATQDAQLIKVQLEYSNDLVHWNRVNIENVITKMFYQGNRLDRSTLRVGNRKAKYFRLSWPESDTGMDLFTARALGYIKTRNMQEYSWTTIKGTPEPGHSNVFRYDTGGYFPATRARIVLPPDVATATVSLDSTNRLTTEPERQLQRRRLEHLLDPGRILRENHSRSNGPYWRSRSYNTPVYDIKIEGIQLKSEDIHFSQTTDRFWRVRFSGNSASLQEAPQLRLGWLPDKVTFLASGKPPYRLLVGNENVSARGTADTFLVRQMRDKGSSAGEARLGEVTARAQSRGGSEGKFSRDKTLNWILWAVMIVGVLTLVWMTWRLIRQLPRADADE
ncbi:MAG: DUF3999 family protein [Acidiferrobacterales bacterium]